MLYLEYNKSKKNKKTEGITFTTSTTYNQEYLLLVLSKPQVLYPNINAFPTSNYQTKKGGADLTFISDKNYETKKFCFLYGEKYYNFETEILKADILIFTPANNNEDDSLNQISIRQEKEILEMFDTLELTKAGNQVDFSTVKANFGYRQIKDLPLAYQEVRIWEGTIKKQKDLEKCSLVFTGYIDSMAISGRHHKKEEQTLELTLLTPMALTTKRTVTATGIHNLYDFLNIVLEPLINDGFILKSLQVENVVIKANYFVETIETVMNDLSNKINVYWYVNEKKEIYVIEINKLLNGKVKYFFDEKNKVEGLFELKPTIEANNYFNVINVKNARLYTKGYSGDFLDVVNADPILPIEDRSANNTYTYKTDENVAFANPIDISVANLEKLCEEYGTTELTVLQFETTKETEPWNLAVTYIKGSNQLVLPNGMSLNQNENDAYIILQKDSFFKSLITGFTLKSNTENKKSVEFKSVCAESMLKYQLVRMRNSIETTKNKEFVSESGIIETTIDANEKWFTKSELINYCNSLMVSSSNQTTTIECSFDEDYNLEIGDLLEFNMPNYLVVGRYIITEIKTLFEGTKKEVCIKAQNSNLTYTYIDYFRNKMVEESDSKYNDLEFVEYISEGIVEKFGVYVGEETA